jgi:hypothetical protein
MLARLDLYVPQGTRIVIVQGGYNDVMADSSAAALLASISGILSRLTARRINTVLCRFYNQAWDATGRVLARHYGAQFVDGSVCYDARYRLGRIAHDSCRTSSRSDAHAARYPRAPCR